MRDNMGKTNIYDHCRTEKDENNIVWLYIDKADSGTNVLSADLLGELDAILTSLAQEKLEGLVILSEKELVYIACLLK